MIEPNELYLAKRKLAELILLGPRKAKLYREIWLVVEERGDGEARRIKRDEVEKVENLQFDLDSEADYDYSDARKMNF